MASVVALGRAAIISTMLASGGGSYTQFSGRDSFDGTLHVPGYEKPRSKSNLYRQPNLQRVRPTNVAEVRRKQFAQRMMWYGEVVSNEEIVSKDRLAPETQVTRRHSSAEIYIKRPASILKHTSSDGSPPSTSLSLSPTESLCSPTRIRKSAHFRENVDVIYYDQKERPISSSTRNQEKLKDQCDSTPNLTESVVHVDCPLHPGNSCSHDDNNSSDSGDRSDKHLFPNKKLEIVRDDEGKLHWKIYVPIGGDFIRNKTSVKALSGGRRLILMAYKFDDNSENQGLHQYIEKLCVPHAINAYGVKATMDKIGNLKINAAISDDITIPDDVTIPNL